MARPRRPNEPSSYETQPEIPTELRRRYDVIRAVLAGTSTISEAARELSIARVNMQTLVHRVEVAILEALQPRPTGPTPKPASEKALEARNSQLEKENARLTRQLQAADDMMMAAGEIIRSLRGLPPSTSRPSSPRSKRSRKANTDEEPEQATPEPILRRALHRLLATTVRRDHMRMARTLGIATTTLRRWIERLAAGQPLVRRRGGTMRPGPAAAEQRVRDLIDDLHGLVGAATLARSVHGVSRRRAAQLKCEVVTHNERNRRAACARVRVTQPGAVRGFDAMHLSTGFALVAADASVPFRTTIAHVAAYDADHVAAVLDEDFRRNTAPLVLRSDRARCHTAPPVASVLRAHGVLLLQGPPYYAPYYGQLERQNAEHRAWCASVTPDQAALDRMKTAVNERWLRPTLDWRSAAECWESRPSLDDDRDQLHDEVTERAERLRAHAVPDDLAMRLAIEQALIQRGYLRITLAAKGATRTLSI